MAVVKHKAQSGKEIVNLEIDVSNSRFSITPLTPDPIFKMYEVEMNMENILKIRSMISAMRIAIDKVAEHYSIESFNTGIDWMIKVKAPWKITIVDMDGWSDKPFDAVISRKEFFERLSRCTLQTDPELFGKWELIH